jgi:MFS transporter, OFA family, oxalate/formate antiporter
VSKWFPDRRGLAGGLVVGGFGLGAFIYSQVVPRLGDFHALAVHAGNVIAAGAASGGSLTGFDPSAGDVDTLMQVFRVSGLVFLFVGLPAASLLRDPPDGYVVHRRGSASTQAPRDGYPPSAVLAMPVFYLLWIQLFANVIAGITIISNAVFILADLTKATPAAIAPLFGMVSIFNAVGRFLWGGISDRIGCKRTFAVMFAVQATTLFLLSGVHHLGVALVGFSVVLLCCGGGFGTMPSYNAQCFGTKYMGLNYGLVLSAWGFAGLVGPILVARAKDVSGSFSGVMPMTAIVLSASVILPLFTRSPPPPIPGTAAGLESAT